MNKNEIPAQNQVVEHENMIKKKDYLLEKIYDKYKMEIARKDRLEAKAIGYYTIIGISLAAFLIIEPILFNRGYLKQFPLKDIIAILNYIFMATYIVFFILLIINLHQSYKPKERDEFDPITYWDTIIHLQEDKYVEEIKRTLKTIITNYVENNNKIANRIKFANNFCLVNILLVIALFIISIITYFI